jgi:DNA-binding transcriptional LysR family regulator
MALIDRVAHRLKLRDLRLLDVVVQSKSMARAAVQLNLTQPAVSKGISELEHTLGVRLLDRSRNGIEPTPHGRALLRRGAAIFDELRQGVTELEFLSDPTAGEVHVATSEPTAASFLPIVIGRMARRSPRASVFVTQSPIGTLSYRTPPYRALREREVDLVLGPILKPFAEEGAQAEKLFDDPPVVAAGVQNEWCRRRTLALGDLMDEPWCLPPIESQVGARCAEAFRASGLQLPRRTVVSVSIQLQVGLLATGRFLTILPSSLLSLSGRRLSIKALPIRLPVEPTVVGIVTLRNRTISPVARLFMQSARDVAKPLNRVLTRR